MDWEAIGHVIMVLLLAGFAFVAIAAGLALGVRVFDWILGPLEL